MRVRLIIMQIIDLIIMQIIDLIIMQIIDLSHKMYSRSKIYFTRSNRA